MVYFFFLLVEVFKKSRDLREILQVTIKSKGKRRETSKQNNEKCEESSNLKGNNAAGNKCKSRSNLTWLIFK